MGIQYESLQVGGIKVQLNQLALLRAVVKALYGVVITFAVLLTVISLHSYHPVKDPITPIGILDRLSFIMGIHEQTSIVVLDLDLWSSTVYTYLFHRRINDGSFHLANEKKETALPGLFGLNQKPTHKILNQNANESSLDLRISQLLNIAKSQQPSSRFGPIKFQSDSSIDCQQLPDENSDWCKTKLIAKISNKAIDQIQSPEISKTIGRLVSAIENSQQFSINSGTNTRMDNNFEGDWIGTMEKTDERALQWFAINLLTHNFHKKGLVSGTAVILDVGEEDLNITFAIKSDVNGGIQPYDQQPHHKVIASQKLSAFGHMFRLITVQYEGLGLYAVRSKIYSAENKEKQENKAGSIISQLLKSDRKSQPEASANNKSTESLQSKDGAGKSEETAETATNSSEIPQKKIVEVHSPCVNPIVDSHWRWNNTDFHVMGLVKGDHEIVKARNGPFEGKRVNRPVANFSQCNRLMSSYVTKRLHDDFFTVYEAIKKRPIYMEGLLKEKCIERGLSQPDKGGDVKMKQLHDSLRHACKVPNTEQPFACTDLMFLTQLLEQLMGLKSDSILHSSRNVGGMTAEWPLASAFYVYQNGL